MSLEAIEAVLSPCTCAEPKPPRHRVSMEVTSGHAKKLVERVALLQCEGCGALMLDNSGGQLVIAGVRRP